LLLQMMRLLWLSVPSLVMTMTVVVMQHLNHVLLLLLLLLRRLPPPPLLPASKLARPLAG
jgi:hypothetical protein